MVRKNQSDLPEASPKNMLIAGLLIAVILLLLFVGLRGTNPCTRQFPPESNDWCTKEGYYIGALDSIFYNTMEGGWTETYKDIALITINETYNFDDPPVEAYGELYLFNSYAWEFTDYLQFPFPYLSEYNTPLVPLTYNDYSVTEDLMFMSLLNVITNFEGNATVLNFTISHAEQYVTMTQECDTPVNFFNPDTDFITEGYFYGVEYTMDVWIDYPPNETIYLKLQIVAECNSGIPLFQSLILSTYLAGFGCVTCSIFSLKTIATSFALIEV